MNLFIVIILTILLVIIGLAVIAAGFLFNQRARKNIRLAVAITDLVLLLISFAAFYNRAIISDKTVDVIATIVTVIFTSQLICAAMVLMAVIIRFIFRRLNKPTPFDPERRRMLAYSLFYPIFSFVTAIYANQVERNQTVDRFFDIKIKNLPTQLEGFIIAQISDIHLGAFYSLEKLENLLNRIVASNPDILAITGDIFDSVSINDEAIRLVNSFCDKFKYGIWYCHGNHEHHRGIEHIEYELRKTDIHVLVNQSERVNLPSERPFYFVGVDYPVGSPVTQAKDTERQYKFNYAKREFLVTALNEVPKDSICILLAHHPEFIDDAAAFNIPLTLTGHTHGSQVGIFGVPLFPVFKYTRGMVRINDCYGYVHCGNGSWFPFRLGCPPEIAYFKLTNDL